MSSANPCRTPQLLPLFIKSEISLISILKIELITNNLLKLTLMVVSVFIVNYS